MWWADGIRFGCTACGRCCVRRVPAASAPLAEAEMQSMAKTLGLPLAGFKSKYTARVESENIKGRQLKVDPAGRCLLLTESGQCSVHSARPASCRTYPFWPENLASRYEWARESIQCEGIQNTWVPKSGTSVPTVSARSVEDELLVEELRTAGHLHNENWTHSQAMEYIGELREANMSDLELEPLPAPRKVLWHEGGLVVLETAADSGDEGTEHESNLPGMIRSLHFESSIGVVQTEVRYHPERGFDYSSLVFGVHEAFLQILQEKAALLKGVLDATVVVLGGGGGVLPMALKHLVIRHRSEDGPLKSIRTIVSVEKDHAVADLGRNFFGFEAGNDEDVDLKLHIQDALNFIDSSWKREDSAVFAILVDIAGEVYRSSGGEVLAPNVEFLRGRFVTAAALAVQPKGVVAWNVLVSELGEENLLQSTIEALRSAVPDDKFEVVLQGPIRRSCGVAQWLLIGSWREVESVQVLRGL